MASSPSRRRISEVQIHATVDLRLFFSPCSEARDFLLNPVVFDQSVSAVGGDIRGLGEDEPASQTRGLQRLHTFDPALVDCAQVYPGLGCQGKTLEEAPIGVVR